MKALQKLGTGHRTRKYEDTLDYYRTPEWAVDAILDREELGADILDPCAGDGIMGRCIAKQYKYPVVQQDIADRGCNARIINFLEDEGYAYDSVIMNPPFKYSEQFVRKALDQTKLFGGKVLCLSRLSLLETQALLKLFTEFPPARVYVFSKRVNFFDPEGNEIQSASATCWVVWDWTIMGNPTELKWI